MNTLTATPETLLRPENNTEVAFIDAYLECALWATLDQSDENTGGSPLNMNYHAWDFSQEALDEIEQDCLAFFRANRELLETYNGPYPWDEHGGYNFFLTRNHHGCGYWDGDYHEEAGEQLTDAAHAYGTQEPYVGDNGKLYLSH